MAHGNKTIPVPVELRGLSNPVTSAEFIYDYELEKTLEEINQSIGEQQSNQDSFNTLKDEPDAYLKNVQYDISNNNVSFIELYTSTSIRENRADQPLPIPLKNLWSSIYLNPEFTEHCHYHLDSNGVYNLIPGLKYFYSDRSNETHTFTVDFSRRFLYVDNVRGVRDLGGIPTKFGGYIAYDKIIRGSELNSPANDSNRIKASSTALSILRSMNITLDMDLRTDEEAEFIIDSPLGTPTKYDRISFITFQNINTLSEEEKSKIKTAFEKVATEVINGGKVYIHCVWGYHRCGFLCTLIEGILGATLYEIDKDYELSSFSPYGIARRTDSNYRVGINTINEQYNGSWVKFAEACGISSELINRFRKAMIVEISEEQEPAYYEVTYEELVNLRNTNKLIPGAKYRMIDFDTYDGGKVEVALCSGIPDLPEFKSAYHHFDLLLTALSTNELDSNVKALHSARDTEGYFNNTDLAKWDLKYDLNNDISKYSWTVNYDNVIRYEEKQEQKSEILKSDLLGDDFRRLRIDIGSEGFIIKDVYQDGNNIYGTIVYSTISQYIGCKVLLFFAFLANMLYELNVYGNDHIAVYYLDENCIKYLTKEVPIYEHIEGKGVIYYMKDEYNNEVPYDFKNIMFKYQNSWYYTFNSSASNVVIKPWIDNLGLHLNKNIFVNNSIVKDCFFDFNTHDNIMKSDIVNVKVGIYSNNNTLINLDSVKLGLDNINVYLENFVDSNIGNVCYNLELYGNDNVIIVEDFISNKIGVAVDEYTKIYNGIEYSSIKDINTRILYTNGDEKIVKIFGTLTQDKLYYYSGIKEVEIGASVTSIGNYAFDSCYNLTSVTIPNSVTSIGNYAFDNCSSLTSVTIPESVTSIGERAFDSCSNLTSVTIPNSVTSIGSYAFYGCSSLTSVTIPDSVTIIGSFAFDSCYNLTSVTIPNSVTNIGIYAFHGCSSLTSVAIPNSVTSIGERAFYSCSNLTSVTIPNSVTSIGVSAFRDCTRLTSVTIPDSVTSIEGFVFYGCTRLTSIILPDSVTSIGSYAFHGCSSLTSVAIPNSVTSIGYSAFQGCSNLTSITIPDSVTSIGGYAFHECRNLTSVTIPDSVTSIGYSAFESCSSLTSVTCLPVTPPTLTSDALPSNVVTIKVPAQSVDAYKSASGWSDYASKIVAIQL